MRAPTTTPAPVPVRAPTMAAAAKGPAAPAVRPTGVLASATKKGRPTGEWGRMTTMVPMMVPAGTPTMVAAAKVPAAPATGLAGALAPAAKKGG
jgi:hypothetical protein